jgi:4-amino-4-deoxy-L-arabinose transferase-like glycosyltransferase
VHPPLQPLLMAAWIRLFGDGEVAVRLPALLCGLGAVAATAVLGRALADRRTGLLAALLVALSPAHVWYSQEARVYSLGVLLVLLAAIAYHRLEAPGPGGRPLAGHAAALAGAVAAHLYLAVYAVVFPLLAWRLRHPRARALRVTGAAVLLALGTFLVLQRRLGSVPDVGHLRSFGLGEGWLLLFHWFLVGNALWALPVAAAAQASTWHPSPRLLVELLACALLVRGLSVLPPRARGHLAAYLLAVPAALLGLALLGAGGTYIERAALAALPFFWIALARGAWFPRRAASVAAVAGAVTLGVASYVAWLAGGERWTVYKPNPDWRSAARALAAESRGATVPPRLLVAEPNLELAYYERKLREEPSPARRLTGPPWEIRRVRPGDRVCTALAPGPFYVVRNLFWPGAVDEVLRGVRADPSCSPQGLRYVAGVELHRFVAAGREP